MPTIPSDTFAAVLGSPVEHSLSPILHRAAYSALGLNWRYEKFDVQADELAHFVLALPPHCRGLSITMPLKDAAFAFAARHDEASILTGACNTLVPEGGSWCGFNTDVPGFVSALQGAGVTSINSAIVLGAGATARSAIVALMRLGVSRVAVAARRVEVIDTLRQRFANVTISSHQLGEVLPPSDVLISTLPGTVADRVDLPVVPTVFDVVYAPWPTLLARKASGRIVLGGLDLLVAQAVEQVLLMTEAGESQREQLATVMHAAGLAEQVARSQR